MESFESEGSTFRFQAGGAGKNELPGDATPSAKRSAYRPPLGVPVRKNRELGGKIAAIAVHLFFLLLLLAPLTSPELRKEILGAGGLTAPGGGGGGSRGSGGGSHVQERTQYVKVAPPPPVPVPQVIPPLVPPPVKPPEAKPPVETPKPPSPVETKVEAKTDAPPAAAASVTAGAGGGAGNDGTAGNGVGSGGGVGSGAGTGRGSGTGPGTGGGNGTVYPPTPTELFIPPMPPPSKIKGFELIAQFDVDSTGKVIDFEFTQTKDGAYNKKLKDILGSVRFRPGVNERGVPVRAKTQIVYTF